jgi:hypothetical protein
MINHNEMKEQEIFKKMKACYHTYKGRIPLTISEMATFLKANGWNVIVEKRTYTGPGRKKGRIFTQSPGQTQFTYLNARKGKHVVCRGYPDTTLRSLNSSILAKYGYFGRN